MFSLLATTSRLRNIHFFSTCLLSFLFCSHFLLSSFSSFNSFSRTVCALFFFFNDPAPPEISPLSLHDALPISQAALAVGDAPEAQAAREVLLVELEIGVLAGITLVAAPHLQRRLGIADEGDGRAVAAARGDAVRRVGRARLVDGDGRRGLGHLLARRNVVAIEEDGRAGGHEV